MSDTADREECIYCHKSILLDENYFDHTTTCEMSESFDVSRNSCEITGTSTGTKEIELSMITEQTEDEDVEIISVTHSSGRDLSLGMEPQTDTSPISNSKETFRTLGVGLFLSTDERVEGNEKMEQTILPATLPIFEPHMPQNVDLNGDTNFNLPVTGTINYSGIYEPRMPLGIGQQTINGQNLQPRVNYTSPILPTQPPQFCHQSNYQPRATFQNNMPLANQGLATVPLNNMQSRYQGYYQQGVNYSATTNHFASPNLAGFTSNRQNQINIQNTFQTSTPFENPRTSPHNMYPPATFQPTVSPSNLPATFQHTVPPSNPRDTLQFTVSPLNPRDTFQHTVPPSNPPATFQHTVPPSNPPATFQHTVPPSNPPATFQHTVPPSNPPATFQHTVPPSNPPATFQHTVPPSNPPATFQHTVPPSNPRDTFQIPLQGNPQTPFNRFPDTFQHTVPPTNQLFNAFQPHYSTIRPPTPFIHQNTMPILHQGHILTTSHPTSQMPHFNPRMSCPPPHPINTTEVSSGRRMPPSVPSQIQPFVSFKEPIGTIHGPLYRPEHYSIHTQPQNHLFSQTGPFRSNTMTPIGGSHFSQGPPQFQVPQSGTFITPSSATSHLTFPQPDVNCLSPGLGKTIMAIDPATRMSPLDTFSSSPSQGFSFPYQPRFPTCTNRFSQLTSIVPEPSAPHDQHRYKPNSAPHSLTETPDLRSYMYTPPTQRANFFTLSDQEMPPPLPPRKHQSAKSPLPCSSNPWFGIPSEMWSSPPIPNPPPYNPGYETVTDYSMKPPVLECELTTNCSYCDEEFYTNQIDTHMAQECMDNPDVAERYATYSEGTMSSSSGSDVECTICANNFTPATIVSHMESCFALTSYSTMTSETVGIESSDTMTHSGLESLEVEDEICRRCNGKFTLSSLKSHAENCLVNNPELLSRVPVPVPVPVPIPSVPILLSHGHESDETPKTETPYKRVSPFLETSMLPTPPLFSETPMPTLATFHSTSSVVEKEIDKCELCGKKMPLEELPTHVEECRDKEEGKCPNCKKKFLVTILPDHTDRCQVGKVSQVVAPVFKIPVPAPRTSGPESNPTSYRRCNLCHQDVPPRGHKCVPLPPEERRDNLCGVCFLEMDPDTMETHRIECLKSQQSEYTELHTKNWQRCLSCLIDVPPEDFKQHIRTCDDMLLGDISRYKKFTPNLADIDWATAALTKEQRDAMDHVVKNAQVMSNGAAKVLSERVAKLNFAPQDLEATLEWINFEAPIIIHVFLDKLLPILIADTNYRNQFETGTSHGSRDLGARSRWEDNIFKNIYRNVKAEDRVKYGVLNIVGDINGVKSCKQYGDSYFLLKRVRLRTSFASADSSNSAVKIASCEHYKHVLNEYTDSELKAILKVAAKKEPYLSSDVIQQYKEVQIHGPIEFAEHLECVVANPRHKTDHHTRELLEAFITKNKCNLIWMS